MTKILKSVIINCYQCLFIRDYRCLLMDEMVATDDNGKIPNWCPLPDDEQNQRMRWVHVSKKLPDDFQQVLIYSGMTVFVATYSEGEFYYNNVPYYVGYWMPLPSPLKIGDNNE